MSLDFFVTYVLNPYTEVYASPCVFIDKWGETFFACFHLTTNTPAHLQPGKKLFLPR